MPPYSQLCWRLHIEIDGFTVQNSHCEKLLAVHFDDQLRFDFHIEKLCKNANRKLHALARVTPYMDLFKKRILVNAFFDSQFNYCPLIWMCHSRKLYHKINRVNEKCIRIIYNDKTSSYKELLSKDGSFSMHYKNLQKLVIEIYKVAYGLCPEIMNKVFQFQIRDHHNLTNNSTFRIPSFNAIFKRKECVFLSWPKLWSQVPDKIKSLESPRSFEKAIKKWVQQMCQCIFCRIFLDGVGFIS